MHLKSGIYLYFYKNFILDENGLRRITAQLQNFIDKLPNDYYIVYQVHREDQRFYETLRIEDVLNDPNIYSKRIDKVEVYLIDKIFNNNLPVDNQKIVQVVFDIAPIEANYKSYAFFMISFKDKTASLQLADDLEPQIIRILFSNFWVNNFYAILFYIYSILILLGIIFGYIEKPTHILNKKNIDLFDLFVLFMSPIVFIYMLRSIVMRNFVETFETIKNLFFQESVFLIGDEIVKHQVRKNRRDNIFWVIIIGTTISIITGILSTFISIS